MKRDDLKRLVATPALRRKFGHGGPRRKRVNRYAAQDIAYMVRRKTSNGEDLIDVMVKLAQGKVPRKASLDPMPEVPYQLQADAAKWLTDRGFGKMADEIHVVGNDDEDEDVIDVGALTDEQLDQLEQVTEQALAHYERILAGEPPLLAGDGDDE